MRIHCGLRKLRRQRHQFLSLPLPVVISFHHMVLRLWTGTRLVRFRDASSTCTIKGLGRRTSLNKTSSTPVSFIIIPYHYDISSSPRACRNSSFFFRYNRLGSYISRLPPPVPHPSLVPSSGPPHLLYTWTLRSRELLEERRKFTAALLVFLLLDSNPGFWDWKVRFLWRASTRHSRTTYTALS